MPPAAKRLFIGIMSGTSLDGADAVAADFSGPVPHTLGFATRRFPQSLRESLFNLCEPGTDPLDLAGQASLELADVYAASIDDLLGAAKLRRDDIAAVGCHGQTVRHRPALGFTIQLNDPARLAELCGIDVVADFRRRDMAAGGEGAPLVPAFHEAVFRHATTPRAVVNVGGISNVTSLRPQGPVIGFDCGPGNVLMDAWIARHHNAAYDDGGRWAASGVTDPGLLEILMQEPFLKSPPPKSTGRELFRIAWLEERLASGLRAEDVQSTLAEFTAASIMAAIEAHAGSTREIYLAGGGARNTELVRRIRERAGDRSVQLTDVLGVPTGLVEPLAFAWLAMKCVHRQPVDLSAVTGARGPRVLGAIYPA